MKKKFFHFLIWVLCIVFFISGCSKGNENIQQEEEEVPELKTPVAGGEIFLPVIQFATFNPIVNDNQSVYYLHQLIYEGLLKLDEHYELQPALAKSWSVSSDGSEWKFVLRDEVSWHDGKPFTAEDVKFTIDAIRISNETKNISIYSSFAQYIKDVKVSSPNEILIRFDTPLQNPVEIFTFPIIPKHQFNNVESVYQSLNIVPVGTGPYKIESYNKYNRIQLVRYDNYWSKKPLLSGIIAKMVPDKGAALTSVEANEIDVSQANDYDWEKFSSDKTINIYEYVTQEYEFVGFNFNNHLLNDINIRKAVSFGVDRHKITDEVYLGHATVTDAPIHPDSYMYDEEAQEIGYDITKAKDILGKSNWLNRDADEWLENEEGEELRFHLLVNDNNTQRIKTAEIIAEQLKSIGIEVVIQKANWEEYEKRLAEKSYDLVIGGWKFSLIPDLRFALHSNYLTSSNFIGYSNPEMDRLLEEAAAAKIQDQRIEIYKLIQKEFVKDLPYLSLFYKNSALIVKNHIKGNISPNYYNIYNDISNWYVQEE